MINMQCPSCKNDLRSSDFRGVQTYTCNTCSGIWISGTAFKLLLRMENSSYESSNKIKRSENPKESTRLCPTCTETSLYSVKLEHVDVEACKGCSGIYFDYEELELLLPKEKINQERMTAKELAGEVLPYAMAEVIFSIFQ